mmetsp:Transcript_23140/g.47106  ORF Transcript_23140/g.47106 Transcript_23140/m.47106 type:complete len:220 (-) Transcript_23140:107-766(-)
MGGRRGSSGRWIQRHVTDKAVAAANRLGYRSRAYLKLHDLDKKLKLLRPGLRALELGSAPGSWTQVLVEREVETLAVDLLPMEPVLGARFVQGDFTTSDTQAEMRRLLGGVPVDLLLTDLSPNRTGIHSLDHVRMVDMVEQALLLARRHLRHGGTFLTKVLDGEDRQRLFRAVRQFGTASTHKPPASRKESRELYLCVREFDHARLDSSTWREEGLHAC